jgi:glyoxylase I family protein
MANLARGIEHVALASRDPERLAAWYCRRLGFTLHVSFDNGPQRPKTCFVRAGAHGPFIEIGAAGPPARPKPLRRGKGPRRQTSERDNMTPGLTHLAILVSDFDGAMAKLARAGVRREGEERSAPGGARVQFYRDPEGNLFHILYRPKAL